MFEMQGSLTGQGEGRVKRTTTDNGKRGKKIKEDEEYEQGSKHRISVTLHIQCDPEVTKVYFIIF